MRSMLRRLLFFFRRDQFDRDLEDELRFHEDMKTLALAHAGGLSGDEARAAARRRIGNALRLREQSREQWTFPPLETFAQDVRHALRSMRRETAFTFTAAAISQSRSPRHRPVSAANRVGHQDVLDLAAPVVRRAALARHHARPSRGLLLHRRAAQRTR